MSAPDVLKAMSGEGVLRIIRDTCANESARIRADQERFVQSGLQRVIDPGRLAVILALNAAADMTTAIIALGQDAKMDRADPKRGFAAKIKLDLAQQLVAAARAALIDQWGGTEEPETLGEEPDDASAAE